MTSVAAARLVETLIAHQVGSPEYYWAIAANAFLLLWTAALLLAPRWGASPIRARRFRVVGLATAVLASLVTLAGKTLEVWPGEPLFPSGHTAYVVAIAVFLVARDRRWLRWVTPFVALMAVSLVLSFFHIPIDIVGGTLVGLVVAIPASRWLNRSEARRAETATEAPASGPAPRGSASDASRNRGRRAGGPRLSLPRAPPRRARQRRGGRRGPRYGRSS